MSPVLTFLSQTTLLGWLTFLLEFSVLLSYDSSIWSTVAFSPLGNYDMLLSQFPLTFLQIQRKDAPFHCRFWLISCWLGRSSWLSERCSREDTFNIMHLLLLLYFKSGYRLGLMFLSLFVNIKPSLIYLLGLSVVCTAAKGHQNNFFRLHQQNKSSTSKVKFRQSSNYCKRVFKAPKLLYVNKTI